MIKIGAKFLNLNRTKNKIYKKSKEKMKNINNKNKLMILNKMKYFRNLKKIYKNQKLNQQKNMIHKRNYK